MPETLSVVHSMAHLSEIVDGVEHEPDHVVLTRNGQTAGVVTSPEDLDALKDTSEELARVG